MRVFYCLSNCRGSKLGEEFLKNNSYEYKRKNVSYEPFTETELLGMDSLTPNGIYDLVNINSFYIVENYIDYKNMRKRDLIDLIIKNPTILSYPIVVQSNIKKEPRRLIVGFHEDEWKQLETEVKTTRYYNNISKLYKFNHCCFYDEIFIENNSKK